VEGFWEFAGTFWWLIFPIGGAVAAAYRTIAKNTERSAKRRHQQRLEIIRAKQGALPAAGDSDRSAKASKKTGAQPLARVIDKHDEVRRRWLDYELDVAKLIAFPAMSDGRQPLTAAFLRAGRAADALRPASASEKLSADDLRQYREAVIDYESAFDVAERDARRVKDSSFSAAERKRLDTATQLLTVAIDQAATPAERQLAYRRVREELDGLLLLSDEAIDALEKKVALELTTGPVDAPAPASTASGDPAPSRPAPPASEQPPIRPRPGSSAPSTAPGRITRPKQS
jgi:hypothetical protein